MPISAKNSREGKEVELVTSTKLLSLTIANDLTWNDHVTEITKKASKTLFPNSVKVVFHSQFRIFCWKLRISNFSEFAILKYCSFIPSSVLIEICDGEVKFR